MHKNIPNSWVVDKIGNLADYINGYTFKQSQWSDKGLPIIRIQNLTDLSKEFNYFNGNLPEKFKVQKNDFLISWSASLGAYIWQGDDAWLNQHIFKVANYSKKINPRYLYYFISSQIKVMENQTHGVAMKHITRKNFENIEIPLPKAIEEQEEIVKILDASADMVRLRQECIKYTEDLTPAIFYKMFGDPALNDKEFKVKKLGDLTTLVSSGATPKGGQSTYLNEGITFIRSQNVLMNRLDLSDVAYISRETHDKMARSKVMQNDILLNITGASIGRVTYYEGKDDTANVNQHVCIIRPRLNEILPEYLSSLISMSSYQSKIMSQQSGATRQAFNYQQIKKFDIILPSIEQQKEFIQMFQQIEEYKKQQRQELEYAGDLFQSLLQKAFTGELTANKYKENV